MVDGGYMALFGRYSIPFCKCDGEVHMSEAGFET
jgi:hypothetical protein